MFKRINASFGRRQDFNVTAPDSAHCGKINRTVDHLRFRTVRRLKRIAIKVQASQFVL
jgi:hypothetical protein